MRQVGILISFSTFEFPSFIFLQLKELGYFLHFSSFYLTMISISFLQFPSRRKLKEIISFIYLHKDFEQTSFCLSIYKTKFIKTENTFKNIIIYIHKRATSVCVSVCLSVCLWVTLFQNQLNQRSRVSSSIPIQVIEVADQDRLCQKIT